jgi:hypothetical protein
MKKIDGENLIEILEINKRLVEFQEKINEDKQLYDLLQDAIMKLYDSGIYVAEKIEKQQKEWSAKNGL